MEVGAPKSKDMERYSLTLYENIRMYFIKGHKFWSGGLWDNAMELYKDMGIRAVKNPYPTIIFPSGANIRFASLQREKDVYNYQGAQICLLCFDEINHLTESQVFYMFSRNRSTCGVRPYIRATCNPDADSWLANFIKDWIADDGYPIPEMSGKVRYFTRVDSNVIWGDNPEDIISEHPNVVREAIKSFTFIASKLTDNKILMEKDPQYLGNLNSLSAVEKGRLLDGNWKIRPSSGAYFKKEQFEIVEVIPHGIVNWVRSWDLACTEPSGKNPSPDATAGILMGKLQDGRYIIADCRHACVNADKVRQSIFSTATLDKSRHKFVHITIPQDAGQAGKDQAQSLIRMLSGYPVTAIRPSGSKIVRATPFSAQVQAGNVIMLKGDWNEGLLDELEAFPEGQHDDRVDACSDAFNRLQDVKSWSGLVS